MKNKKYEFALIGLGFGIHVSKEVSLDLQFGYGAYDVLGGFYTLPAGELGLYYKF